MTMVRRAAACLLVLLPLALLLPAGPAGSQEGDEEDLGPGTTVGGQWAVEPSGPDGPGLRPNFAYNLEPGQTIVDTVSISNLTEEEITFHIYPKDAYNTPRDAGFALLADDEDSVGVGTWITMGTGEYVLAPRTRVDVPFQVTVPEDAEPGDHAGGILASNASFVASLQDEGVALDVRQRVAARVYVRVAGPLTPALRVDRIESSTSMPIVPWLTGRGHAALTYEVTNVGNVRLTSEATVKVTGLFGRTIQTFDARALPELLPGASVVVTQSWSGLPPVEPLSARVTVEAEVDSTMAEEAADGVVTTVRSHGFFVWSWAAVVVALAILAYLAYRIWRRYRGQPQPAPPPDGDLDEGADEDDAAGTPRHRARGSEPIDGGGRALQDAHGGDDSHDLDDPVTTPEPDEPSPGLDPDVDPEVEPARVGATASEEIGDGEPVDDDRTSSSWWSRA